MKPLLVPVDFSRPANNAARYALQLGKKMKSNLFLCHAYPVHAEQVEAEGIAWALYEGSTQQDVSDKKLEKLATELKIKDEDRSNPASFHPAIFYGAVGGNTIEVIRELSADHKIGMIVLGSSGTGAVSKFFTGSVARSVIDTAGYPALLVPAHAYFKEIRKIAFATNLDHAEIPAIHSLSNFARQFGAEVVLTYISGKQHNDPELDKQATAFQEEVARRIPYEQIVYRHVQHTDIDEGLNWLADEGNIDLLAMVHRNRGLLSGIFSGSHTRKLAARDRLPLLVFPAAGAYTF
jgi:nucleotide-binding universal stress UspA family protein